MLSGFGTAKADFLVYEFSGVLPSGASQHSQIEDGETWNAEFVIDTNVVDTSSLTYFGYYLSNVQSGLITFSGGYSQHLVVDGWNTLVFNDAEVFIDGDIFNQALFDGVRINPGPGSFPVVSAYNITPGSVNSTLDSENLPLAGTSFTSSGANGQSQYQFNFEDQITGERVFYNSSQATNISFAATAVIPESSALAVIAMTATIGILKRGNRRVI
ncbi:MAG: hypothetical protein AAGC88_01640 [Bacteroidota bacterium]